MPQQLFDALAGSFGHGVDRPQLNAYVANSQTGNALRSAQTEEAMNNAQMQQEQMQAHSDLETSLGGVTGDDGKPLLTPSAAHLVATELVGKFGDAKTVMEAYRQAQQAHNTSIASNPAMLGTPAATAAVQGNTNKLAGPEAVAPNYYVPAGVSAPDVQQTPLAAAQTAAATSAGNLHQAQADNPQLFHPGQLGAVGPDGMAALTKAVSEGRLDPRTVNSRTAPILAQMEQNTPGTNYNRLHADASLQANPTFQQRAMSVDMLPGLLSNMTTLGKNLNNGTGYNDVRTVGQMQQWANGELNDPDYTQYMTVRNDALLRLASVMRGVGMSDQAHTAEVQAAAPTLAPYALDAWLKGQMAVITPLLARQNRITHLGEKGQGTAQLGENPEGPSAQPPAPLGSTAPTVAAPPSGNLPSYPSEQAALAAGHKAGDRVIIGGVSGTLQ